MRLFFVKNVRNFRLFQPQPADKTLPAGQGHGLLPAHGPQQQRRPGAQGDIQCHPAVHPQAGQPVRRVNRSRGRNGER